MKNKKNLAKAVPDYKGLFKFRPKIVSREFSLWLGENNCGIARFGVILLKKNIKMAVARNRSKRFAKEIFSRVKQNFVNKDVVLVIKKFENQNLPIWKNKMLGIFLWLEHFGF